MSISDRNLDRILSKILKNNKKFQHRSDTKLNKRCGGPGPLNCEKTAEDKIHQRPNQSDRVKVSIKIKEPQEEVEAPCLDEDVINSIRNAIESFQCCNNTVTRTEFEEYLKKIEPNLKLKNKKRDIWKMVQQFGLTLNPTWIFKY